MCNSGNSCRYSFPGLSYTLMMIPLCCGAFSSKSVFRSGSIVSTSVGSSSIFSSWCACVIVSLGLWGGLGGGSGRIWSLHTGNLYPGCLGGGFLLRVVWL